MVICDYCGSKYNLYLGGAQKHYKSCPGLRNKITKDVEDSVVKREREKNIMIITKKKRKWSEKKDYELLKQKYQSLLKTNERLEAELAEKKTENKRLLKLNATLTERISTANTTTTTYNINSNNIYANRSAIYGVAPEALKMVTENMSREEQLSLTYPEFKTKLCEAINSLEEYQNFYKENDDESIKTANATIIEDVKSQLDKAIDECEDDELADRFRKITAEMERDVKNNVE